MRAYSDGEIQRIVNVAFIDGFEESKRCCLEISEGKKPLAAKPPFFQDVLDRIHSMKIKVDRKTYS